MNEAYGILALKFATMARIKRDGLRFGSDRVTKTPNQRIFRKRQDGMLPKDSSNYAKYKFANNIF